LDSVQAIILAVVQGITEFLPVSSSGHLILLPQLLGWEDQGLAFDVMVHLGTLLAVLVYFRQEVSLIVHDTFANLFGAAPTQNSRIGWQIALATVPVGLLGFFWGGWVESSLRNPRYIAIMMILFAVVLWWVDKHNKQTRDLASLTARDIVVIGCAQAISLMPGVSRSGMTIAAALLMGLNRDAAARFSFLMAIPVIILAGGLKAVELMRSESSVDWSILLLGVTVSALVAYACIHWFLGFIRRFSMLPFALYLLGLGVFLLWVFKS
jgi:undecaprenyl-diphosphatase